MDRKSMLTNTLLIGALVSAAFMLAEGVKSIKEKKFDDYNTYSGKLPEYLKDEKYEQRRNFAYQSTVVILLICLIFVTHYKN